VFSSNDSWRIGLGLSNSFRLWMAKSAYQHGLRAGSDVARGMTPTLAQVLSVVSVAKTAVPIGKHARWSPIMHPEMDGGTLKFSLEPTLEQIAEDWRPGSDSASVMLQELCSPQTGRPLETENLASCIDHGREAPAAVAP